MRYKIILAVLIIMLMIASGFGSALNVHVNEKTALADEEGGQSRDWIIQTVDSTGNVGWDTSLAFDSSNQTYNTYNLGTLDYNTTYYWMIVAWDNHGASTIGSIWEFTTELENMMFNFSISLCAGWNFICFPVDNNYYASDLCYIIPNLLMVSMFDGFNQTFKSYICGGPPGFDFVIKPGDGIFVLVNENSIWYGEG